MSTEIEIPMAPAIEPGTDGPDTIFGGDSKDSIRGEGGDDYIYGVEKEDTIRGGDGDDWLQGGRSTDKIFGDAGDDTIRGDNDADTIQGGDGDDIVFGGPLSFGDRIDGGNGDDYINGEAGNDLFARGGYGKDTLIGGSGVDTLIGSQGIDTLRGMAGDNVLEGGKARDTFQIDAVRFGDASEHLILDFKFEDRLELFNFKGAMLAVDYLDGDSILTITETYKGVDAVTRVIFQDVEITSELDAPGRERALLRGDDLFD